MNRLTTIQRRKIRELYLTHWLYSHLAAPAKEMECRLGTLRISPEELFVECAVQLDHFLDHPGTYDEVVAPSLWNDYFCQLREESPVQITTEELELGATELTYVINYLLCAMTDRMMATQVMVKLTQSLMAHATAFAAVEACYQTKLWTSHAHQFVATLNHYAAGQERLSATLLQQLEECNTGANSASPQGMGWPRAEGWPAAEGKPMVEAVADMREPSLRIGYKKLSRALIVLDAMIQQGWIVDKEGNRPSNRDAALNEILQLAFGEEKARQISSTMYPSHIPREEHEEYREQVINELLELSSREVQNPSRQESPSPPHRH